MTLSIFCPNTHLILNATRCPKCGWERPQPSDIGSPVWGPVSLGAGLGGLGRHVFARPALAGGVAVFPWRVKAEKRPGKLVGLEAATGELRWKSELGPGERTPAVLPDGNRLLAGISDVRSLEESEGGRLIAVDPLSGQVSTLWKADGHQVSSPTLTGEHLILRTSSSALVAFSREDTPREIWRQPLNAWWAEAPFVAGDTAIVSDGRPMHGEGYLQAYHLTDGTPRWKIPTNNLLSQPPTALGPILVIRDERKDLLGIHLEDGREVWRREYKRIYSPPVAGKEHIFISVRGPAPSGQEGHYLLQALKPGDGEVAWERPLPARVRILGWGENTLFGGSDDGHVLAYSPTGKSLWTYILGSDENPVRTELTPAGEILLAGTYFGKAVALRVSAPPLELEDPQVYQEKEEYESAAAAYALNGDMRTAAKIYAQQLQDVDKAFALYEHAALFQEAGELASSLGLRKRASDYFQKAGNKHAYAEELIQNDDLLGAAQVLEQLGDLMKAASLYEKAGDLRSSMEVYKHLNRWGKVLKLMTQVSPDTKDVQDFEKAGKLKEAGETAFKLGMYGKAAKLYQEAEETKSEFKALEKLAEEKAEDWGLERMAELARGLGKFRQEAQAWEKLGRTERAAQAYHRAARQMEQIYPSQENAIAQHYEKAKQLFDDFGLMVEAKQCWAKVVHYRKLPQVIVTGQTEKPFREGEFNMLALTVHNVGRGVACELKVIAGSGRFEIDKSASNLSYKRLAPGTKSPGLISLRPLEDQVGEAVPLVLEWIWEDKKQTSYQDKTVAYVHVKRKDESVTGGTPQHVHYHDVVYQTEGTIEVIGGDKVGGDQIEGDKVAGQKGDRVSIHRGEGVRVHGEGMGRVDTTKESGRSCPNCHLPVEQGEQFCQACGVELV